jgi:hypothetical protein
MHFPGMAPGAFFGKIILADDGKIRIAGEGREAGPATGAARRGQVPNPRFLRG